jgi:hypothetical protein
MARRINVARTAAGAILLGPVVYAMVSTAFPLAGADPPRYMFGRCYIGGEPVQERPVQVAYGCDGTGILQSMTWTAWGADGADGTGTDNTTDCVPNCAAGQRYINPVVVHAWNPRSPTDPGCPAGVQFYADFVIAYPKGTPPGMAARTSSSDSEPAQYQGMPAIHYFAQKPYSCTPPGTLTLN